MITQNNSMYIIIMSHVIIYYYLTFKFAIKLLAAPAFTKQKIFVHHKNWVLTIFNPSLVLLNYCMKSKLLRQIKSDFVKCEGASCCEGDLSKEKCRGVWNRFFWIKIHPHRHHKIRCNSFLHTTKYIVKLTLDLRIITNCT